MLRFMERPLSFLRMHWDHAPVRISLSQPSATLSPARSGGEGEVHGKEFSALPQVEYFPKGNL